MHRSSKDADSNAKKRKPATLQLLGVQCENLPFGTHLVPILWPVAIEVLAKEGVEVAVVPVVPVVAVIAAVVAVVAVAPPPRT